MKIAIYSRKSKFTGKGDSIGNQIELCKDYAERYFDDIDEYYIYEDEGFSGGDTNRPKFQELMRDAQDRKFDVLICYRLDRVSRNVADFSATIEDLEDLDVDFISIKEQFDTSTPMGRAMMHIASVFAQLERETISERVRDNMMQLAATGRWLGGTPPLGFKSKKITSIDGSGKERSYTKLEQVPEELKIVEYIYDQYLNLKSISQVASHLMIEGIKTINGYNYSTSVISAMLRHPVYVKADRNVIDYLEKQGMNVVGHSKVDNQRAILTYNKETQKGTYRDKSDWIVAVANHHGIMDAEKWLLVQSQLDGNSFIFPPASTSKQALLGGLVRCGKCGSSMMIKYGSKRRDGSVLHYYACRDKSVSKGKLCDSNNLSGIDADLTVANMLFGLSDSNDLIKDRLESLEGQDDKSSDEGLIIELEEEEETLLGEINNLVEELSKSTAASRYILPQIESKDKRISEIKKELLDLEEVRSSEVELVVNHDLIISNINDFASKADELDNEQKKFYIRTIVDKVIWDEEEESLDVVLFANHDELWHYHSGSRTPQNRNTIFFRIKLDRTLKYLDFPENTPGERARKQSGLKGYSIQDLADKTGLSYSTISSLQSDDGPRGNETFRKVAAALGVSVSYLKKGQ